MEVEEREIDADGNVLSCAVQQHTSDYSDFGAISARGDHQPNTPMIRDSSRNRLQRLGALYSDNENLSSPIHRNEARFDAAEIKEPIVVRNTARSGKLAALASSINSWEDDVHPDTKDNNGDRHRSPTKRIAPAAPATKTANSKPKVVGSSPNKNSPTKAAGSGTIPKKNNEALLKTSSKVEEKAKNPVTKSIVRQVDAAEKNPSKQLKWDKNVMDSLEAQGFTRRESTTSKMVYEYSENDKAEQKNKEADVPKPSAYKTAAAAPKTAAAAPKPLASIGKGLVSGRAALFESSNSNKATNRVAQKDPAEMSLKDRLALFEKNKGEALMPKAAFGMSASSTQISNTSAPKQRDEAPVQKSFAPRPVSVVQTPVPQEKPKIDAYNKPGMLSKLIKSVFFLEKCID